MPIVLGGKAVVVTGAGSGIGRATARAFAQAGARVAAADLDGKSAEATVRLIDEEGGEALAVQVDVSEAASVASMVEQVEDALGRLDCACNIAGIENPRVPTAELKEADWDRVMRVDLKGVWLCMKHELRSMLRQEKGGAIVNVASAFGKVGFRKRPAYVAAKHGVVGLTRAAALEYAEAGIRVNAVCPSFIDTPMQERIGRVFHPSEFNEAVSTYPMGRLGRPNEVAEAILWLASDAASFVTGQALSVDGGYTAQ